MAIVMLIFVFIVKEITITRKIIMLCLYIDAAALLITIIPFGIYFECKRIKFVMSTPQFKKKVI